jgi:hypothetical protein
MIDSRLRIYCGPEDDMEPTAVVTTTTQARRTVTVPAREVFASLADAIRCNRAWLRDFDNDEVTISSDLYEVILAYQHFHRPSA